MPAQQPLTAPLAPSLAQPFSVRIQTEPLDPAAHRPALPGHASGAEVRFIGKVRNDARNATALSHLVLEHFPGVTEGEIERIVALARQRWALQGAHVTHRVGPIAAGEDIVMVTTHSAHRRDAYEANVFIMDYLKTEAPFWKQECFADGSAHWVQAKASDQQAQQRWAQRGDAAPAALLAQRRMGALVLAGGQGSRMGYVNKGLQALDGRPLVQHVIDALRPQVQALAISANHDLDAYRALGFPVVADAPEYQGLGPLAGIASATPHLPPDLDAILVVPCDTPRLPADLTHRLAQALFAPGAPPAAMAATAGSLHPSILLFRPGLYISLLQHLKAQHASKAGLSLRAWLSAHGCATVHFDDDAAFINVNDRQALAQLHRAEA